MGEVAQEQNRDKNANTKRLHNESAVALKRSKMAETRGGSGNASQDGASQNVKRERTIDHLQVEAEPGAGSGETSMGPKRWHGGGAAEEHGPMQNRGDRGSAESCSRPQARARRKQWGRQ